MYFLIKFGRFFRLLPNTSALPSQATAPLSLLKLQVNDPLVEMKMAGMSSELVTFPSEVTVSHVIDEDV